MKTVEKKINGIVVTFHVAKANGYVQVIVLVNNNYVYSVMDGLSESEDNAIDNVTHFLINNLK